MRRGRARWRMTIASRPARVPPDTGRPSPDGRQAALAHPKRARPVARIGSKSRAQSDLVPPHRTGGARDSKIRARARPVRRRYAHDAAALERKRAARGPLNSPAGARRHYRAVTSRSRAKGELAGSQGSGGPAPGRRRTSRGTSATGHRRGVPRRRAPSRYVCRRRHSPTDGRCGPCRRRSDRPRFEKLVIARRRSGDGRCG